jgi:hypothetical protein
MSTPLQFIVEMSSEVLTPYARLPPVSFLTHKGRSAERVNTMALCRGPAFKRRNGDAYLGLLCQVASQGKSGFELP